MNLISIGLATICIIWIFCEPICQIANALTRIADVLDPDNAQNDDEED